MEETTVRIVPHLRSSAAWNLALEEALFLKGREALLRGEKPETVVHLYSFDKPSVILGNNQRISEIDLPYCQEQGVDVTMRKTGGGSVFLGPSELQYSLIMPTLYSRPLLKYINQRIIKGLNDVGVSPRLVKNNQHHVIRLGGRGFVFDAQRRTFVYGKGNEPQHLLLHHGTVLIEDKDYDHMPAALKATPEEVEILRNGNVWLRNEQEVGEQRLIQALKKTLPPSAKVVTRDFSQDEEELAWTLYKGFYNRVESFRDGKKQFGICYKTTRNEYDMEKYAESEEVAA